MGLTLVGRTNEGAAIQFVLVIVLSKHRPPQKRERNGAFFFTIQFHLQARQILLHSLFLIYQYVIMWFTACEEQVIMLYQVYIIIGLQHAHST